MMVIRNPVGLTRGSEEIYHISVGYGGHIGRAEAGGWDRLCSTLGTVLYLHKNAMRVKLTKNHFLLIY